MESISFQFKHFFFNLKHRSTLEKVFYSSSYSSVNWKETKALLKACSIKVKTTSGNGAKLQFGSAKKRLVGPLKEKTNLNEGTVINQGKRKKNGSMTC
jgi:hypothetical protein